jgi:Mannosyltransferase (PIG-V)
MSAISVARGRAAQELSLSPWGAFWRSRLLVWVSGCVAMLAVGASGDQWSLDPYSLSSSFGPVGNVLMAPAIRWDSIWYVQIAHTGYSNSHDPAFFPLYPLLIRVAGWLVGSFPLAGLLVSLVSLLVALQIVHRLTEFELGAESAGATVVLLAFTPMAVFFSAVYTESLFLALSAGMFLAARRERWWLAGMLGGLAAATRVTGVLLVIPFAMMFWEQRKRAERGSPPGLVLGMRRHGAKVLWGLLIPAGVIAYSAFLAVKGYGWTASMTAQDVFWGHYLAGPFGGVRDGVVAAVSQVHAAFAGRPVPPNDSPLLQLGVLVVCALALVGAVKRLSPAYVVYAVAALLVAISSPTSGDPLRGLDRYAAVLFPLFMAGGAWAAERGLTRRLVLVSSFGLVFFAVQFATWRFVA